MPPSNMSSLLRELAFSEHISQVLNIRHYAMCDRAVANRKDLIIGNTPRAHIVYSPTAADHITIPPLLRVRRKVCDVGRI